MIKAVCSRIAPRKPARTALATAAVVLAALAEQFTGASRLTVLCLVPVSLATWFSGKRAGLWTAIASGATFLVTDLAPGRSFGDPTPAWYWNTVLPLAVFVSTTLLLSRLREDLVKTQTAVAKLRHALANSAAGKAQLEENARRLAESNLQLEQYAQVIAHDLKSPLVAVGGYLQLLVQRHAGRLGTEAERCVAQATEGVRRLEWLIDEALASAKSGGSTSPVEAVDSNASLARVLKDLRGPAEECGAVVTSDRLPAVAVAAGQMDRLFQNLVGNAIKYRGAESPRVHVSAVRRDSRWLFTIRDNGVGVDPTNTEEVFRMFKRSHHQEDVPGNGIGLAVCKRIVEGQGGRIWLQSEPGKGSKVHFYLPDAGPVRGSA